MKADQALQTARRATAGRNVLGWTALAFLLLFGVWWYQIWADVLRPPSLLSPQSILTLVISLCYAIVLPLFWSMLIPSSPAGRLLQKQTWALPGQVVVMILAAGLTAVAIFVFDTWLRAQPEIVATNLLVPALLASVTGSIFVPAICWSAVTPEQWIAQIKQARDVARLEHAIKMDEAAMRAAYARAIALLNSDLSLMTMAQRHELAGILGGFARLQEHSMRSLARSWKDMYGVEANLSSVEDTELLDGYKKVAALLDDSAEAMGDSSQYARDLALPAPATPVATSATSVPVATVSRDTSDSVGQRRTLSDVKGSDGTFVLVCDQLQDGWTSKELAELMRKDQRTAQRRIGTWMRSGWIVETEAGRYRVVG